MPSLNKSVFGQCFLYFAIVACYVAVIWPGLHGGFVFDDWSNLRQLEDVKSWRDVWTYTFSGVASTLGRPIALFTFALQAEHWVDNPFPFKVVNAVIHLVNGVLLYGCTYLSASFLGVASRKRIVFAVLCSFLWLILPLNTTTVFYVVQRMTLLAGTFTLVGLYGFLYGVLIEQKRSSRVGYIIASASMIVGYFFGILSKENAIMLGLFVGVVYVVVVRSQLRGDRRWWDAWVIVFACLPMVALFFHIVWDLNFLRGYKIRDFTLSERLLTEWRILWDYFFKIILPTPNRISFFNDNYSISRGLLDPSSTVFAGTGWLITMFLAWKIRVRFPFFLFAIAWFIGGHLLESTIYALELYFEHRNYFPSIGVVVGLVWFVFYLWDRASVYRPGKKKVVVKSVVVMSVVLCSIWYVVVFYIESKSWESEDSFHAAALKERPDSYRANQAAASYLAGIGEIKQATYLFYAIDKRWPGYPGIYAYLLYLQCVDSNVVIPSKAKLEERFSNGRLDGGMAVKMFTKIHKIKQQGACPKLSWDQYRYWVSLLMNNPKHPKYGAKQNLLKMTVLSYVTEGDIRSAVAVLDPLDFFSLRISTIRLRMELLMMLGRNEEALSLIQQVKSRFSQNRKIWISQGHYFLEAETEVKNKLGKVKRLFDINKK